MIQPDTIQSAIEDGLPCEHVQVTGDGHHFEAVIVSAQFRGKTRVQQHKMVYDSLQGDMGGALHALALQTSVPD